MPSHILVVDDNELNLTLIAKILELEGYQVTMAHNGLEAIQAVVQSIPDLTILDIMMPDLNGYELCNKLRGHPLNVTTPIVMLTAMSSETEKIEAMKAGANDIWSKPFDMEHFRLCVKELLQTEI